MVLSHEPKSICILRLSAIGDVCHAVSAVQAIQAHYPNAKITWVLGKIEAMLLADLPGVEFVIFDKKQGKAAYQTLKNTFKGRQFDVLLHMQVALRANIAAMYIPAKVKLGFDWKRAKEGHYLFTNRHIEFQPEQHVLEGFRQFACAIGVPHYEPSWKMPLSDSDWEYANQAITSAKTLVLAPAASKAERNWLPERYAAIADYAISQGFNVVITGGPTELERSLASDIMTNMRGDAVNLVGKTSLKQLTCVLAKASLVIAPDTGPAHMAVTMATPVIGLYAHSNPARTGPYLYQKYVVEVYHKHVEAQFGKPASELPWGTRAKGKTLMHDISVDAVKAMFDKVVEEQNL